MQFLFLLFALLNQGPAQAEPLPRTFECYNHTATYRIYSNGRRWHFKRIASRDDQVEFGPYRSHSVALSKAQEDCKEYAKGSY